MKKPKSMSFEHQGEFYGYPPCCIVAFIRNIALKITRKRMKPIKPRQFHGTGYVPCAKCNKKSEKELLEYIKNNRQCDLSFPNRYNY